MKRMTYKTVGDATRASHYAVGQERKDEIIQRLGRCEDALAKIQREISRQSGTHATIEMIALILEEVI